MFFTRYSIGHIRPPETERNAPRFRCLGPVRCGTAYLVAMMLIVVSLRAQTSPTHDGAVFKSDTEFVNVNATVVDAGGQFVSGLHREDFVVYEDDVRQTVSAFSAGRVPVSLGMALDSSASMVGDKMPLAKRALDALVYDLLSAEDEFLLYGFGDHAVLLQGWTADRRAIFRALDRMTLGGRTALYDVVAEALPRVQNGRSTRRALVIVSDGNDNRSEHSLQEVKDLIRQTETPVYAIGINCSTRAAPPAPRPSRHQAIPTPLPFRFPRCPDPVDAGVLRQLTDPSGGRTEIVDSPRDLERATTGIADELSQQYDLGYASSARRDGRWHTIRVELQRHSYHVRARNGYVAK